MAEQNAVGILVKLPGMKRAEWLGSNGTLTTRRIHAQLSWDIAHAERVADSLREKNPGVEFTVRAL